MRPAPNARVTNSPWRGWLAALLMLLVCVISVPLRGQEAAPAPVEAGVNDVQPAPAPVRPTAKSAVGEPRNYLIWLAETSGLIGLLLLVLSIYFVATVVRLFVDFRRSVAMPPALLAQIDQHLQVRDVMAVYKLVKETPCFFSSVLRAGITEMQYGLPESREAIDRAGEVETVEMERRISMLAVLGTLGPMIGLVGTLNGMISAFEKIARLGEQLNATAVASSISEALVITLEGVALSVPAIYFFAVFRNRLSSISAQTMLTADEVMRRIFVAARKRAQAGSADA